MPPKIKVIACDFDGTLVSNAWPEIGAPNHEMIRAMIQDRESGNKVILWTGREGKMLRDAVEHALCDEALFKQTGIPKDILEGK